jgi:hypothetical protein
MLLLFIRRRIDKPAVKDEDKRTAIQDHFDQHPKKVRAKGVQDQQ